MLLVPSEGYIVRIKKNGVDEKKTLIKLLKKIKIHTQKIRIKGLRNLLYLWCQVYFIKVYKFILFLYIMLHIQLL